MKDTNILKTILSQQTEKVLSFLEKEIRKSGAEVPTYGILTGQIVCDKFLEFSGWNKHKKKMPTVLNDIDHFVCVSEDDSASLPKDQKIGFKKEERVGLIYCGYGGFIGAINGDKYEIVRTKTSGVLNTTDVYIPEVKSDEDPYQIIISQFDINCTQIGIDLSTGEVLVTNEFLRFYQTGQMEISYPGTPFHTPIRFVRKMEEHGFYGNVRNEMIKVMTVVHFFGDYNKYFSDKQSEAYDKYEHILGKYFTKVEYKTAEARELIEELGLKDPDFEEMTNEEEEEYLRIKEEKENEVMKNLSRHVYTLEVKNTALIAPILELCEVIGAPHTYNSALRIINMHLYKSQEFLKENVKPLEKEIRYLESKRNNGSKTAESLVKNFFFEEGFVLKDFRKIRKMCVEHERITSVFLELKTFEEVLEVYEEIKALVKIKGKLIYGLYEQDDFLKEKEKAKKEGFSSLEFVEKYLQDVSGELTEKSFEDYEDEEWKITELISFYDLLIEGVKRNHCVGGYGNLVKRNVSKILSVENKLDESLSFTTELRKMKNNNYRRRYESIAWEGELNFRLAQIFSEQTEEEKELFNPGVEPAVFFHNAQSRGKSNSLAPHADEILKKVKALSSANVEIVSDEEAKSLADFAERTLREARTEARAIAMEGFEIC